MSVGMGMAMTGMGRKTGMSMVTRVLLIISSSSIVLLLLLLLLAPNTTRHSIKIMSIRITHGRTRRRRFQTRVDTVAGTSQSLPCSVPASTSSHAMFKHHLELSIVSRCRSRSRSRSGTEMRGAGAYRGEGTPSICAGTSTACPCGRCSSG